MTCFAYETMCWQCSIEDCEVLFQGNFPNNSTYIVGGICHSSRGKIIKVNSMKKEKV